MGVGRIEIVGDPDPTRRYLFVHVLDIADESETPGSVGVKRSEGMIKVTVPGQSVAFRADQAGLAEQTP